jgi:hypothetical protein
MATIRYEVDGVTNVIFFDATMSEQHEGLAEVTEHEIERGADLADHVKPLRPSLALEVMISNTPIPNRGYGPEGRLVGAKVPMVLSTPASVTQSPMNGTTGQVGRSTYPPGVKLGSVAPVLIPFGIGNRIVQNQLDRGPRYSTPPEVTPGRFSPNDPVSVVADVFTFANPRDRLRDLWEALNKLRTEAQVCAVLTRLQDYENMLITRVGAPVEARDAITFSLNFKQISFAESLTFVTVDKVAATAKKAVAKKDLGPKKTFTVTNEKPQSIVDMGAAHYAGYRTPDEVLGEHPNPTSTP